MTHNIARILGVSALAPLAVLLTAALTGNVAHADGNNPGSLLIYPEYDTTSTRDTLITVTNTSPALTIRITFEYVSPATPVCLMTDRHATLSPNDTLTVLVSNHLGDERRGFLYVYASDALGNQALSQNFLIGDDLLLDGVAALQYSVTPLVFRALTPLGTDTDVDHDGIRDLNGIEYEPAPGRILIPRFMGQVPDHYSDLILIGLSGGGRFNTIADFVIFNDNEVPLSAQYTFPCWKRVPLLEISNVFLRSFLANNTDDAPAEILGQSTYESGWMIIDGNIAQSGNTVIVDPAMLAVLVEMTGARMGSEIPFIQGRRSNGALFPQSQSGQTP